MSRRRRVKSALWQRQHNADPYVQLARSHAYRSRAAYKLLQIDQSAGIFRPGMDVVDLGAAPGGWSQVIAQRIGKTGRLIAVDILPMQPILGAQIVHGCCTEEAIQQAVRHRLGGVCDVVTSDMAPNLTGIASTDQENAAALAHVAVKFAVSCLRPRGALLIKLFEGEQRDTIEKAITADFHQLRRYRPTATRQASRELYLLAYRHRAITA